MKNIKSRIVALVVALAMVLSLVAMPVAAAEVKADVQPATKEDAAKFLSDKKLLQGDENGDLMLDKDLTREQMMVIMSRLLGVEEEAKSYDVAEMTFQDVPQDSDYAPYVAWAQATGITQGHDEATFGFGEEMTGWQAKAFFVRALGYKDTADDEIEAKADELKVTAGSTADAQAAINRAEMALLMANTVFATNADGKVLGEELNVIVVAPKEEEPKPVAAPEVKEAKVEAAEAVKVVFNAPVADTTKLAFELKGTTVVETKVAFNEAKTEATLTAPSILLEGVYTVKVTGAAEGKNTATLTVVKNGIAKIEVLSEKLVQTSTTTATFKFKLSDNYGKDITEAYASDLTIVSSVGNGTVTDTKNGIATITSGSAWAVNPATPQTVAVTIIGKTTAVTAAKTLQVAEAAKVDAVALGAVTFPTTTPATTKVLTKKATAAYIPVEAKDQYGDAVTTLSKLDTQNTSDVYYVVSDSAVTVSAETYTDTATSTDKVRLVVNTTALSAAKVVTVTAISKSTGKTAVATLEVKEAAKADKLTVLTQEAMIAEADKAGTFVLPIKVYDQYGVELTADEIVSNAGNFSFGGDFELTVDGAVDKVTAVKIETAGVNKGKIVNAEPMAEKGTKVLTVNITGASAGVGTYTVDVKEKAYPKTIKVDQAPAQNLLDSAKTEMFYQLLDQYGRKMELAPLTAYAGAGKYKVKLTLTGTDYVTVNKTTGSQIGVDVVADKTAPIAITGKNVEGTAKLKAELYDEANSLVVSSVETSVTTVAGVPGTLTLEVADIPTLTYSPDNGTNSVAVDGSSAQARPIKLTAKDASGNTFALPTSRIVSVSSSDVTVVAVSGSALGNVAVDAQDNNFVVGGVKTAFTANDAAGATKTATITVVVSTDAGLKEIAKTVTVKKESPKVATVKFFDKELATGERYAMPADAKEVTSIVGRVADIDASEFYIVTIDQYGVYTQLAGDQTLAVVNADRVKVGTSSITWEDANNTLNVTGFESKVKKDSDIFLMYQDSASKAYGQFMIKATDSYAEVVLPAADSVAPIVAANGTGAAATIDAGDKITIKFSEPVVSADIIIANITVGGGHTLDTSTIAAKTAGTTSQEFVITLAGVPSIVATDTLTIAAAKVVDAVGNVAGANVVFTVPAAANF